MRRLLLILAVIAGLFVVAAVGVITWATFFLDLGAYREQLTQQALRYTGREVTLEGDLSLDLFPGIAVETGPIRMAPRAGFGEAPMIEAEALKVFVQIMPLLHGRLEIEEIRLVSPRVRLGIAADGATAWGDIAERAGGVIGRGQSIGDGEAIGAGAAALAVNGLSIEDGVFEWTDAAAGSRYDISAVELNVDRLRHQEFGEFDLGGHIEGTTLPEAVDVSAKGRLKVNFDSFDASLEALEAAVSGEALDGTLAVDTFTISGHGAVADAAGVKLGASRADASMTLQAPEINYRRTEDAIAVDRYTVEGPGFAAHGDLTASALSSRPAFVGKLESDRLDLVALLSSLGVDIKTPDTPAGGESVVSVTFSADTGTLDAERLELRVGEKDLRALLGHVTDDRAVLETLGDAGRLTASARVHVDLARFDTAVEGLDASLAGAALDARLAVDSLRLSGGGVAAEATGVHLSASRAADHVTIEAGAVRYQQADDAVVVDKLVAEGPGMLARGAVTVSSLSEQPRVAGSIASEHLDLAALLGAAGIDVGAFDPEALADSSLAADFEAGAKAVRAKRLDLGVGDSDLRVVADISLGEPVRIEATLESKRLDLDALLAEPAGAESAAAPVAVPVELLRAVEGNIEAHLGRLVSGGAEFNDVALIANSDGEAVRVERLDVTLPGGRLSGTASLGKVSPPPLAVNLELADADAGVLLDQLGLTDRVKGRGGMRADLEAVGLDAEAVMASLDGTVALSLRDGEVRGIDVGALLRAARGGQVSETGVVGASGDPATPFSSLDASIVFEDGVGESRDLELVAPEFSVRGGGQVDLPRSRVDYGLEIWLVKDPGNTEGTRDYERVPIPLRIHGDLAAPSYALDVQALMKAEASRRLQREAEKRGIEAPDAGEALKGLLRRKLEKALQ